MEGTAENLVLGGGILFCGTGVQTQGLAHAEAKCSTMESLPNPWHVHKGTLSEGVSLYSLG